MTSLDEIQRNKYENHFDIYVIGTGIGYNGIYQYVIKRPIYNPFAIFKAELRILKGIAEP